MVWVMLVGLRSSSWVVWLGINSARAESLIGLIVLNGKCCL
jgi:hypothetical protein